jgi:hypothetical protein
LDYDLGIELIHGPKNMTISFMDERLELVRFSERASKPIVNHVKALSRDKRIAICSNDATFRIFDTESMSISASFPFPWPINVSLNQKIKLTISILLVFGFSVR